MKDEKETTCWFDAQRLSFFSPDFSTMRNFVGTKSSYKISYKIQQNSYKIQLRRFPETNQIKTDLELIPAQTQMITLKLNKGSNGEEA